MPPLTWLMTVLYVLHGPLACYDAEFPSSCFQPSILVGLFNSGRFQTKVIFRGTTLLLLLECMEIKELATLNPLFSLVPIRDKGGFKLTHIPLQWGSKISLMY